MKADINFPAVEGVTVAIAHEPFDDTTSNWRVFILNETETALNNVLIASKGYGTNADGEKQETSVLRFIIESLPGLSAAPIELISPEVFHLVNEYWVSYYIGDTLYDKKFLFMPDSILTENLQPLPILNVLGILHD